MIRRIDGSSKGVCACMGVMMTLVCHFILGGVQRLSSWSSPTTSKKVLSPQVKLPLPNISLPPISIGACCGIGHRLARNIPTMVYAVSHSRLVHVNWQDITWNTLFNDTVNIKQGPMGRESYGNEFPSNWTNLSLTFTETEDPILDTSYRAYGTSTQILFELPLAQSIAKSLAQHVSPLVLSFLTPMRLQYAHSELHLCAHVREGNNETGDWKHKTWRHIELHPVLNSTLVHMALFARSRNSTKVSVFVASDNKKAWSWFEENAPADWHMVKPARELPRPETGVWFGQHGSDTNANLTQQEKDEAMAEAVADVFALGECDALFIPNYSSFSAVVSC